MRTLRSKGRWISVSSRLPGLPTEFQDSHDDLVSKIQKQKGVIVRAIGGERESHHERDEMGEASRGAPYKCNVQSNSSSKDFFKKKNKRGALLTLLC